MSLCSNPDCSNKCPICKQEKLKLIENESSAILRGHGFRPIEPYVSARTPMRVVCENHHIISVVPSKLMKKPPVCRWCKKPKTLAEKELFEWLESIDEVFYCQFSFKEWSLQNYRYDVVLPERNLVIEVDGRQHFEVVSNWAFPDDIRRADIDKMYLAINHNYKAIRMYQPDMLKFSGWRSWLHYHLLQQEKTWDVVIWSFDSSIYDKHIRELKVLQDVIVQINSC